MPIQALLHDSSGSGEELADSGVVAWLGASVFDGAGNVEGLGHVGCGYEGTIISTSL